MCAKLLQSCPTLCNPLDSSLVLSCLSRVRLFATLWTAACQAPLPGILQGRILEWVAMLLPWDLSNSGIELRSPTVPAL